MTYQSHCILDEFYADTRVFFAGKLVAVTGGSGFIGSHLVEQLLTLGAHPVVLTRQKAPKFLEHIRDRIALVPCDLGDFNQTRHALEGMPVVLNLAAQVAGIEFNMHHPASMFQHNLQWFLNTIRAASEAKAERFLVVSSGCIYPRACSLPTPEEEGVRDSPEPTNAGYGWAKRMEEFLGAAYAAEYALPVAIARPYNAYGPRDNFAPEMSHVLPALIHKAFTTETDSFSVWGDGTHTRSFLYVDDFARGLLEVVARYPKADAVNIGTDEEITIGEAAHMIAELVSEQRGRKIMPVSSPQGLTGQPHRRCDTRKIERTLGYRAQVPFAEGLRRTVEWYAEYYKSL